MRHYRMMEGVGRSPEADPARADLFLTEPQAWAARALAAARRQRRAAFWRRGVWRYAALAAGAAMVGVAAAHVAWGGVALRVVMLAVIVGGGALYGMILAVGGVIPPVSVEMADDPLPKRRMLQGALIGTAAPLLVLLATGGLSTFLHGSS